MTTYEVDGRCEKICRSDIIAGLVVRHTSSDKYALPSFSDCVISEINEAQGVVHLARPYCYINEVGTPLVGMERFVVSIDRLTATDANSRWVKVVMSTGKPSIYRTDIR